MDSSRLAILRHQSHVAWTLCDFHLSGLTDADCLWKPAADCWTVRPVRSGDGAVRWVPDWAEPEPDPAPQTTIGWVTWHLGWCWSMVYDHAFGDRRLTRAEVTWPGGADATVDWLRDCHRRWSQALESLTEADLDDTDRCDWPYRDGRPFGYFLGWFAVELTKNAAEIGMLRSLRRATGGRPPGSAH